MMPPPRRYSAAPTLTCPHRNKSHSSSSLQHTYSIDSSESMITVIPARGLMTGANSTCSNNSTAGIETGCYARSPLSPRSPRSPSCGRVSGGSSPSGLLTPSASKPPTPFSPANTIVSTTTTTATTVINELPQLSYESATQPLQQQQLLLASSTFGAFESTSRARDISERQSDNNFSSMVVENGTSCGSSRDEGLDDELNDDGEPVKVYSFGEMPDLRSEAPAFRMESERNRPLKDRDKHEVLCDGDEDDDDEDYRRNDHDYDDDDEQHDDDDYEDDDDDEDEREAFALDPSTPFICASINDLCARHSRQELEFLIGRIEWLTISDCYYSEKSSTLCMVLEVQSK